MLLDFSAIILMTISYSIHDISFFHYPQFEAIAILSAFSLLYTSLKQIASALNCCAGPRFFLTINSSKSKSWFKEYVEG